MVSRWWTHVEYHSDEPEQGRGCWSEPKSIIGSDQDVSIVLVLSCAASNGLPAGAHPKRHSVPTPQQGQRRWTDFCFSSDPAACGSAACKSVRHSWSAARRCGFAKKPK